MRLLLSIKYMLHSCFCQVVDTLHVGHPDATRVTFPRPKLACFVSLAQHLALCLAEPTLFLVKCFSGFCTAVSGTFVATVVGITFGFSTVPVLYFFVLG